MQCTIVAAGEIEAKALVVDGDELLLEVADGGEVFRELELIRLAKAPFELPG